MDTFIDTCIDICIEISIRRYMVKHIRICIAIFIHK